MQVYLPLAHKPLKLRLSWISSKNGDRLSAQYMWRYYDEKA
jgi:hypothetical protein